MGPQETIHKSMAPKDASAPGYYVAADGTHRLVIRKRRWWTDDYLRDFLRKHGCFPDQHPDWVEDDEDDYPQRRQRRV